MTEEANLKASYQPGKKGGNFGLPLGAKVLIPEGVFGKKDSITGRVPAPSQRWRHCPQLPAHEHMTSEIFVLTSTVHPLKKPIILQLPYYPIGNEHFELNVRGKWRDTLQWNNVGFIKTEDGSANMVELQIDRVGTFVVTFLPRIEQFHVSPQGALYNTRLSRYMSVRFPKKALDKPVTVNIQITPVPEEKVTFVRENFPVECADLVKATEVVDILPTEPCDSFRRAATVKLPLPGLAEVEEASGMEVVVLQKIGESWETVDSTYKTTKTTVSFDVKSLSRFCVVVARMERRRKMREAVAVLEKRLGKDKGEMAVFLSLQEKSWRLVVEVFPEAISTSKMADRTGQGFKVVAKQEAPKIDIPERRFFSRRAPPPREYQTKTPQGVEIFDGLTWKIEVRDGVKVVEGNDIFENDDLQYFRHLPESYRRFDIEPAEHEVKAVGGTVMLTPEGVEDPKVKDRLTFMFPLDIEEDTVAKFFYVEPPPEPEPEKPKTSFDLPSLTTIAEERTPLPPIAPKFREIPPDTLARLTRTVRRPRMVDREAKVISGRSLMNISKMMAEGLTLAVYLKVPDSTITGLGFDAIANGLKMSDVTYKILLYWKRKLKDKGEGAVTELTQSLRLMGKSQLADVITDCHKENKEVTPECVRLLFQ